MRNALARVSYRPMKLSEALAERRPQKRPGRPDPTPLATRHQIISAKLKQPWALKAIADELGVTAALVSRVWKDAAYGLYDGDAPGLGAAVRRRRTTFGCSPERAAKRIACLVEAAENPLIQPNVLSAKYSFSAASIRVWIRAARAGAFDEEAGDLEFAPLPETPVLSSEEWRAVERLSKSPGGFKSF